ncbi:MAG: B12-binding domain-containing radical SAM protein [Proteobacteria bacterium]|nr:B12-binding domain-containing radical SAM protein [Pseudomonadota bacterium]
MKIALIAPPYPLEQAPSPPLGICYVASACKEAGHEVKIFDYIVSQYTKEKLKAALDVFQPDILGATSVTMNFPMAAEIMKTAKNHRPEMTTMMGGPHVSFDYENVLNQYPEVDVIVTGEGELTLKELLPVIKDRACWHDIQGIAFMDDQKIVKTPQREFIQNLDDLPMPTRDLLPMAKYMALGFPVSIITSRGCPNKCIFCLGRRMVGMKVRYRSADKILDEIEYLLSFGLSRINIADDFFTANKNRVTAFCEEILKRGIKFDWSAFARVDSVSKEMLEMMKKAGCDAVSFGIESGNLNILKTVQKGITPDQARNAIQSCKEAGMIAHASFILGLPGETPDSMEETLQFAKELNIPFGYHLLAPFPGTAIREDIQNYDLEILSDDWNLYDADHAIVRTSSLSAEETTRFVDEFNQTIQEEFQEAEKRYQSGKCSDEDYFKVAGTRRMEIIFKILSEDIIETLGAYQTEGTENNQSLIFATMISNHIGKDLFAVEQVVKSLHDIKYLQYKHDGTTIKWYWTDNQRTGALN